MNRDVAERVLHLLRQAAYEIDPTAAQQCRHGVRAQLCRVGDCPEGLLYRTMSAVLADVMWRERSGPES